MLNLVQICLVVVVVVVVVVSLQLVVGIGEIAHVDILVQVDAECAFARVDRSLCVCVDKISKKRRVDSILFDCVLLKYPQMNANKLTRLGRRDHFVLGGERDHESIGDAIAFVLPLVGELVRAIPLVRQQLAGANVLHQRQRERESHV